MTKLLKSRFFIVVALGLLTACSSIRPYPARLENNAVLSADTKSGIFTSVKAELDIYAVDKSCQLDYRGTVKLDSAPRTIGLPVEEQNYLVFRFYRSSFLAGTSGSISYETLFNPRHGQRYTMQASYRDSIYNVVIRDNAGREIDPRDLDTCRSRN